MNIAEKVLQLKQDFDEVYAVGKAAGGGSGDYNQGYEDGKNSVVPFERYTKELRLTSLNIFGASEVVLDLDYVDTLQDFCIITSAENANITVEHLTINAPNKVNSITNILYCSATGKDTKLKRLTFNVDTKEAFGFINCFFNQQALEIIDGMPFDFSASTAAKYSMFGGCIALTDFRVVEGTIKKDFDLPRSAYLSTETIQSIIDGLADLSSGTAQTLTLHADVGAKLTNAQKATITAKNWTLVY